MFSEDNKNNVSENDPVNSANKYIAWVMRAQIHSAVNDQKRNTEK